MATLSLKISLDGGTVVKTMQFDPTTTVYDACRIIREKILEANAGDPKEYGLFLTSDEDSKKGIWLEPSRALDYYILRNGDVLEYNRKMRNLRVRMLDGTVKTLLVDDSQIVANLMVVICTKIGITNYDEYGLVREEQKDEPDPCEKPNYGTLTLRRKHQEKDRDAKMDQLRKKLRTDDEVNWVESSKTLREQGIDVTETLLLRRKLFFSDRNVDSRDPVQLNLLYVQARDTILDGTHPVTQDHACEFAGIQCQIQFGDHKEDKHTPGFLDLKEFLPASYVKVKGIEKKVFKEHKKHVGLSELDAKVLYTKTARGLPTYGVAFFLVKEKMKGKNKLVPRLLGVTKDSVLRLDEKTKEILQSWPLTTVRRWCASPNTFTLDFGDYSDQYYSVQTTEAEQIVQVIAGYIDIIMKKQRASEHVGMAGDEGSAMMEDSIAPHRANIIQHDTFKSGKVNTESVAKPAVIRPGEGPRGFAVAHYTSQQHTTISGQVITGHTPPNVSQSQQTKITSVLSEPQRALLSTISTSKQVIETTQQQLTRASLPELGSDAQSIKWKQVTLDTNKQVVTSHIAAMNAATAQVVTLTSGSTDEVDHTAVGAAITTITSNLPEMTKGVQMLAALMDDSDNGDKLLDATRKLCAAFTDLLKAAEPETKEPRQNLLNAASRVGEASTSVLHTIGEEPEDKETQDILLSLAKAVANTTAALVLKAKHVAAGSKQQPAVQNGIITAATHCALATSQLVACTKVVAPTIHNPQCQEQLSSAARSVSLSVDKLLSACQPVDNESGVEELTAAARKVTEALERLLAHCDMDRAQPTVKESVVETVLTATERMATSHDTGELVSQARQLAHATAKLLADIKTEAESCPSEAQRKLLAAAKLLSDATARMLEAARESASAPKDRSKQESLRRAAEELRCIAVDYARGGDLTHAQLARLQDAAKRAASSATQLVNAAQSATEYNTNKYAQETLIEECRTLSSHTSALSGAAREAAHSPRSAAASVQLIASCDTFIQQSGMTCSASRSALPTVQHPASARRLTDALHDLTDHTAQLRSAVNRAQISCKGMEFEAATETIRNLQQDLTEVEDAYAQGELRPMPGQTPEWYSTVLYTAHRSALSSVSRLRSSAASAVVNLSSSLKEFVGGATAAAADSTQGESILQSTRLVLNDALTLVEATQRGAEGRGHTHDAVLRQTADTVTQGMERTIQMVQSCSELEDAIDSVNDTLNILNMADFPKSNRNYGELQSSLHEAAAALNSSCGAVAGSDNIIDTRRAATECQQDFNRLMATAVEIVSITENIETRNEMISSMKAVTVTSSKLLTTAKSVSQNINRPNAKNDLAEAARAVTDAINHLVDVCTEGAPGQKECDAAIRSIQSMRPLLNDPTEPLNDLGYFACLDTIVDNSKGLSEGMSGMAGAARRGAAPDFCSSVQTVADNVCGLVQCAAQAAYIVGVSDPTSSAGRPGLVSATSVSAAAAAIAAACAALQKHTHRQQVLSAATEIAKHTSSLCNACRVASSKTREPQTKRQFVQAAKEVANSTAALVKEIKALDSDYSDENRARCSEATGPLLEAVSSLRELASAPELAGVPARLSAQARRNHAHILQAGRTIISSSCSMIESAKALIVNPQERSDWQALATHSNTLSDSIKQLLNNIRDKAPGSAQCASALETLSLLSRRLDEAAFDSTPVIANSLPEYLEQVERSATEMLDRLESLKTSAKTEAETLGHSVTQTISYAEPLVSASLNAAHNITESKLQSSLLEQARTVLETLSLLVHAASEAQGNPRATSLHPTVDSQTLLTREALEQLITFCRSLSAARGDVGPMLDSLARARDLLTQPTRMSLIGSYDESDSFVDYQTRMVAACKDIARLSTDMSAKSTSDSSQLTQLGDEMCERYAALARDAAGAGATTPNLDVANRIRSGVVELGDEVCELIKAGALCRAGGDTSLAVHTRRVNDKVLSILSALQAGSRGTQACIDAAATIAAIEGDLHTTILFASAGTLHSDKEGDTFSNHRENILKTAKTLVEDTKSLVGGAAGSQELLAEAAQSATRTIVQLCEVVKQGAMSLGSSNPDSQVLLLNAALDVAQALRDLAIATKGASGKHVTHPDMERLKQSAKVMVTNVTSLLKTVKSVEDEHTRGTRALESTIEAINQEISNLLSPNPPKGSATPEELIRHTRQMTAATANAVAAGNSNKQDQLTAAANLGRKTVGDLLRACKTVAFSSECSELRTSTISAGRDAATSYRALLEAVLDGNRAALPDASRAVAAAVAGLIAVAQAHKGSDWVDPDDPTVIAESELLGAAASIDAAAKRLDALRPRSVTVQETDESLNFDEMILQAAKSIIAATSALVRAASAAQRELIDQGKVARRPIMSSDDGQWSEGLISAARLVAAAAHSLVEAANALVQGAGSEERLVSSARQVASSTAQLLVACKVKADPSSESTRRLQSAGAEVIRSTDNLVRAARDAMQQDDERSLVLNRRMVGGIAQEIDARSEVLRIEKELEEARGRLSAIRQAKYKLRGETSGDETDTDVYIGGYSSDASNAPYRVKTPNSSFVNTTYSPNSSYTPHHTQNATNISSHISQLNQSIHGTPNSPGYTVKSPGPYTHASPGYASSPNLGQSGYTQGQSGYNQGQSGYNQGQSGYNQGQSGYNQNTSGYSTGQNASYTQTTKETTQNGAYANAQSPTFSSFRPQDDAPKNYEGFTTRYETRNNDRTMNKIQEETETVVVTTMQLPEVRQAHLVTDDESVTYRRDKPKPPPPPRRISLHNYETRLYDTPRPVHETKTEEQRQYESSQFIKQEQRFGYDAPKITSPLSPKFNARELKEHPKSPFDGVGHTFSEHQRSNEVIPGGTKQSEYTIKSESYQSYPKTEIKSPFITSTPNKYGKSEFPNQNNELVKAPTPDYDRISSPYGKEVHSFGGPNYKEETTTEVKDFPNGTQKITTTKIYSSSPVNITSTNTKYEPIKLDGIDELSKSFDSESKYSTMDSRFNTLDSKLSSDTSRSFMRPSDFQTDYQATTSVTKVKTPTELNKEIDSMDKKFSKQTITSERIEKKSVMTSSHKSETSSTVTKKFGNF